MSLSYKKGTVTKASNALQSLIESAKERLDTWESMSDEDLIPQQRDMFAMQTTLKSKLATLDDAMEKFALEADKIDPTDEVALKRTDETVVSVTDLVADTNDLVDKISLQEIRSQQLPSNQPTRGRMSMMHEQVNQVVLESRQDNLKVPKFRGDRWEFENFWTLFCTVHDNTDKPEVIKFGQLKNCLEGEPKDLIERFRLSEENYEKAKELLLKKYNDKEQIIADLTSKLLKEHSASGHISEQRKLFERLFVIISQLTEYKENIETRMMKDEIIQKFSKKIQESVFKKKMDTKNENWTIQKIMDDLEIIISREEELQKLMKKPDSEALDNKSNNSKPDLKTNSKQTQQKKEDTKKDQSKKKDPVCIYCKEKGHWGGQCTEKSDPRVRLDILRKESRCIQCTRNNHTLDKCRAPNCSKCQGSHHWTVCFKKAESQGKVDEKKKQTDAKEKENKQTSKTHAAAVMTQQDETEEEDRDKEEEEFKNASVTKNKGPRRAFIPTISALAFNPEKKDWEKISIMLDSGADQTYITWELLRRWGLPHLGQSNMSTRTFNSSVAETNCFGKSNIKVKTKDKEIGMNVYVSDNLAGRIPKAPMSKEDLEHIIKYKLPLNEDAHQTMVEPDMILGCDYWTQVVSGEVLKLPSGIDAIRTNVGFTTMGTTNTKFEETKRDKNEEEKIVFTAIQNTDVDRDIEEQQMKDTQMKSFKEFSGPMKTEQSERDQQTMKFFEETVEKRKKGYYVRYRLKEGYQKLPDNKSLAMRRLEQLRKQFSLDTLKMIDAVFKEYLAKEFIEKVDMKKRPRGKVHYNALQAVLTPWKTTTKCRLVVDAGCHYKGELSLNDVIEQGPSILPDIIDMLIRFRSGEKVLLSDVEKAFLQIFLNELDRDLTRVIWFKDLNEPVSEDNIEVYRFTRVLFGINASPFILAATIIHHLKKQEDHPIIREMPHNLYVDNSIITTDLSVEEVVGIYRMLKKIFLDGNMNLREFLSNSEEVNQKIDEADRAEQSEMKVLGIPWSAATDKITVEVIFELREHNSRRTVSSDIASKFDPLGLLSPLLLPCRLLQRELWDKEQYMWDTELSESHEAKYRTTIAEINNFCIELPRHVIQKSETNTIITFCDASKEATACCVYVKNQLGTHILLGKSHARPLKENWTIPKLEMHALMIETEKTVKVVNALDIGSVKVDEVVIMTDSMIALAWIKSKPNSKQVGTLINNRLQTIRDNVFILEEKGIPVKFGHVRSEDNPADLATRGCKKDEFSESIWWNGPQFLQNTTKEWELKFELFRLHQDERLQEGLIFTVRHEDTATIFNYEVTNDLSRMIRIIVYVMRFLKSVSTKLSKANKSILDGKIPELIVFKTHGNMEAEELIQAENILLKDHQKTITLVDLKKMQNLGIIMNQKGIMVCKGRMEESELSEEAKEPILIKPNTQLAKQIISHSHGRFHKHLEHTMATAREKFWIPKLRQQTKTFIRKCTRCQRVDKQPCKYPNMGKMPKYRVRKQRPFAHTGLDNFGPISFIQEDGSDGAAYGTIFACAVTRLIHAEVVRDMSTLQFLQAFRRFVSIRGVPRAIVSDNGSNFVLGQKIIEEAMKRADCPDELHRIEWKFITPYAPWKGGMYESMVKTIKHAFQKAVGQKKLSYDELNTVVQEATASINSRPLTKLEDDIDAETPIRPMDFICQEMEIQLPLEGAQEITEDYLTSGDQSSKETMIRTIEALKSSVEATNTVWNRWQSKYLAELRERHKLRMDNKRGSPSSPKEGQLVLITDEVQPRNSWKMGRVTKLNIAEDGVLRDVDIQTSNGRTLNRAINMLIPLELDESEENSEVVEIEKPSEDEPVKQEKRYDLRQRKKVNYAEDNDISRNYAFTSQKPSFWTTAMLWMCIGLLWITGTSAETPTVRCNAQGLQISGVIKNFEACAENYCTTYSRWSWNKDGGVHVWIPPAIKIHPHRITTKVDDGQDLKIYETQCDAVPFCETIDCTICWSNVINPECHMNWAILGLGAMVFLGLLMIHAMCNVPIKFGDVFRFGFKIILGIFNLIMWLLRKLRNIFRKNKPRITRWREIVVILTIFQHLPTGLSCQEIDILSQIETVCDSEGKCRFVTEEIIHLNQIHNEGCIRLGKNGTTMKEIRIQLIETRLTCVKRTITFTQEIETKVWSSKRCPGAGSCRNNKCEEVTRETQLTELTAVNHYVGNTACSESCGGAGCGCLFLSSGCLFYRIYAFPKAEEPLEVFSCMDYKPLARLKVTVTTLNSENNKAEILEMISPIGKTEMFYGVAITVDDINIPPAPALNSWFIRNLTSTASWPENVLPNYQCDRTLKKCFLEEQCNCSPAQERMMCTCKDTDIGELFRSTDRVLPIQTGHIRWEQTNDSIIGRIKEATSSTLSIKISDNWKTTVMKSREKCSVTAEEARGCYTCEKGASVEIECQSSKEETIANVECDEESFTVPCTPNGAKTTLKFFAKYAKFRRTCNLDCGGQQTSFETTGILKYSGSVWTSIYRMIHGNTTAYNEINMPDVKHLFESYLSYMKTVFIVLAVVGIIFLFTYSIITTTGLRIITVICKIVLWMLWLPIRFLVFIVKLMLAKYRRRQDHTHLHIMILLLLLRKKETNALSIFNPRLSYQTFLPSLVYSSFPLINYNCSFQSQTKDKFHFISDMDDTEKDALRMEAVAQLQDESRRLMDKLDELTRLQEDTSNMVKTILDYLQGTFLPPGGSPMESSEDVPEPERFEEVEYEEELEDESQNITIVLKEQDKVVEEMEKKQEKSGPIVSKSTQREAQLIRRHQLQKGRGQQQSHSETSKIYQQREGLEACPFCGGRGHYADECRTASSYEERMKIVENKSRPLCPRCLKVKGNRQHFCQRKRRCFHCKREEHHSALCMSRDRKRTKRQEESSKEVKETKRPRIRYD